MNTTELITTLQNINTQVGEMKVFDSSGTEITNIEIETSEEGEQFLTLE